MSDLVVSEEEIEAAEKLRGQGEFITALELTQRMLNRAQDDRTRMRLLFDVLYCSTRLKADDITNDAICKLAKLPDPEMSRVFIDLIRAISLIAFGKATEALDLIDANLSTQYMGREDFRDWKYEHLAYRGRALAYLQRWQESLESLEEAYRMFPEGARTTDILIDKSLCMMMFDRYDEAFHFAAQVREREHGDMETLAMQYMAECDLGLGRASDALKLYAEIETKLPCSLVQEERIQTGIKNAMAYLEKRHPQGKPS
jgi:tetratricopeptide (TPR) repeat protein